MLSYINICIFSDDIGFFFGVKIIRSQVQSELSIMKLWLTKNKNSKTKQKVNKRKKYKQDSLSMQKEWKRWGLEKAVIEQYFKNRGISGYCYHRLDHKILHYLAVWDLIRKF